MTDNVLTYLDGYCERAGDPALWAEPLNAVTNLLFIVAAVMAARALLRTSATCRRLDIWVLILFLASIGVGSGLWHLHPTGATVLMDVIPITLFINLYLISAMHRLFRLRWGRLAAWFGAYWAMTLAAQTYLPPDLLHGTIMYIPTYVALVAMTYALSRRDRSAGRVFAIVTTVWSISLICRTIDLEICRAFPIGTHFLWHTLNAWVLWRLLMVLIERRVHPG